MDGRFENNQVCVFVWLIVLSIDQVKSVQRTIPHLDHNFLNFWVESRKLMMVVFLCRQGQDGVKCRNESDPESQVHLTCLDPLKAKKKVCVRWVVVVVVKTKFIV